MIGFKQSKVFYDACTIAPQNTSCYRPNAALIFVANDHFYCKNQSALVACMHNKRLLPLNHTRNQYKLIWHCTLISFCSERLLPQIHTANQLTGIAVLALYINQELLPQIHTANQITHSSLWLFTAITRNYPVNSSF